MGDNRQALKKTEGPCMLSSRTAGPTVEPETVDLGQMEKELPMRGG